MVIGAVECLCVALGCATDASYIYIGVGSVSLSPWFVNLILYFVLFNNEVV